MSRTLRLLAVCGLMMSIACGDDDGTPDIGTIDGGMVDGGMVDGAPDTTPTCPEDDPRRCDAAGTSCSGDTLTICAENSAGCLLETTTDCASAGGTCETSGGASMCVMADLCEGLPNLCSTASRACDGDDLVVCEMNAMGCLVETTTDCTPEMGVCDDTGAMPACATPVDPCAGVADSCATEGTTCDTDSVVTCAPNAFGCLVETTTDCTSVTGGVCTMDGDAASCTATDACVGRTDLCETAGTLCDGPALVTCAMDAFGCLAETTTACTDVMFGFCNDVAAPATCAVSPIDPCAGVDVCAAEGRTCDTDTLTVCAPSARGCLIETTTDCSATGAICDDSGAVAMCGADACPTATAAGTVLGCDMSMAMVMGDTADGTNVIDDYTCNTLGYPGNEQIYRFRTTDLTRVTITSTRVSGTEDYDLLLLDGGTDGRGMCMGAPCIAASTSVTPTETVTFDYAPGSTAYVAYDRYTSDGSTETTTFNLEISCETATCGNGAIEIGETCDDGNVAAGDGCDAMCADETSFFCSGEPSVCVVSVCGNGTLEAGEVCEDGNTTGGDGCAADCRSLFSVDGVLETTDMQFARPTGCSSPTTDADHYYEVVNYTNDGTSDVIVNITGGGAADYLLLYDGTFDPSATGTGCLATNFGGQLTSQTVAAGDTIQIVVTTQNGSDTGAYTLTVVPSCGSGTVNSGETCDDGNATAGDGCSAMCMTETGYDCSGTPSTCRLIVCGDGFIDGAEVCDDGDTDAGDGCSATCAIEGDFTCTGEPSVCVPPLATFSGTLDIAVDPTWARPTVTCTANTALIPYTTHTYMNSTAAAQTVTVTASWVGFDGFLHVFTSPFDGSMPTMNCVSGSDDFGGEAGSRLTSLVVPAGASIVIVASMYDNGDPSGTYSIRVTGS